MDGDDSEKEVSSSRRRGDRYDDKPPPRKSRALAYSPSSEVSHRSSQRYRSLSASPEHSRQSSRDKRARSRSASRKHSRSSSRHSSPELSVSSSRKDTKLKSKDLPKSYQDDAGSFKPSTSLISEIQRTRPRKHSLKREADTDLTELDRALQKGDLFGSPPLKRQALEEPAERSRRTKDYGDAPSSSSHRRRRSRSHSLDYSGAPSPDRFGRGELPVTRGGVGGDYHRGGGAHDGGGMESKFSTPSPSTKSTKSESDKTPDSTERQSAGSSHSSGEISQLEKEKQRLLMELNEMSDGDDDDASDEHAPAEAAAAPDAGADNKKQPRLEEVFDLDWSPTEGSMAKWREQAKQLDRESQLQQQQQNHADEQSRNSSSQPPPKPPDNDGVARRADSIRKENESAAHSDEASRDSDMDTAEPVDSTAPSGDLKKKKKTSDKSQQRSDDRGYTEYGTGGKRRVSSIRVPIVPRQD